MLIWYMPPNFPFFMCAPASPFILHMICCAGHLTQSLRQHERSASRPSSSCKDATWNMWGTTYKSTSSASQLAASMQRTNIQRWARDSYWRMVVTYFLRANTKGRTPRIVCLFHAFFVSVVEHMWRIKSELVLLTKLGSVYLFIDLYWFLFNPNEIIWQSTIALH